MFRGLRFLILIAFTVLTVFQVWIRVEAKRNRQDSDSVVIDRDEPPLQAELDAATGSQAQIFEFESGQDSATFVYDETEPIEDQSDDTNIYAAPASGDGFFTISVKLASLVSLLMIFAVLSFIGARLVLRYLNERTYYREAELRAARAEYGQAQEDLAREQAGLGNVVGGAMRPPARTRRDTRRERRARRLS